MTICACLTDSYDSTSDINTTVWQVCDTVCVDDQEHEDFHAEHPVAAAQADSRPQVKAEGSWGCDGGSGVTGMWGPDLSQKEGYGGKGGTSVLECTFCANLSYTKFLMKFRAVLLWYS